MFAMKAVLWGLIFAGIESKTYYFSLNKTSNEYMIRSRLNMNNSGNFYPSGLHMSELRNNVTSKQKAVEDVQVHPLLDPEWEYNWNNLTRPKLPVYIKKYYDLFANNITGAVRFLFNVNPKNSTIMQYNISGVDSEEDIKDIELHFFHKVEKELLQKPLIMRLYQMENHLINATSLVNPDAHKLLNVIYIYQAASGWQVFKLTNTLHEAVKNRTNLKLFITISRPNQEQFSMFKDGSDEVLKTFLVLKGEAPDIGARINAVVPNTTYCKKHSFPVDFNRFNWMKFIIAPSGYDAFNCHGTCYRPEEPLPNHFRVIKSSETGRKSLCCAPVQYSPLSIMFYDKNANVVLKVYKDMIASVCGCR